MSKQMSGKDYTQKLFVEAGTGIALEKDGQRRCLGCMELYSEEYEVCPYCGYTIEEEVENALHMYPGTVLYDKYVIGKVIGYGGFGVTYLAWDTVLQIKVAVKEYLPSEFSTRAAGQTQITVFSGDKSKQFNDGMEKFIDEAKRLAKFRSENGIVKIFDSFEENGTAYIAMEYLQGETLAERLEREKTIPVEESIQMLMPIIESLNKVHDEGIIHRDIAPDNIFLTDKGEVKLIDFGASRYATTSRSRSLTVIIKPGFSAEEQYRSRGDQGSHTDVYSVGAVLYKMVTGQAPPDAMERRALFEKNGRDMLIPIKKFDKNMDPRRENAIYNALNIRIEDRTPDMISLAGELLSEEPVKKRRSGIKKIDPLTWPLWAKIGIPSGLTAVVALCILLAFGVIGPKSDLETRFVVPDGQTLIPNVVAGTWDDAKERLKKEDLNCQIAGKVISMVIDRNRVLRQTPDAFNVVDQGTVIEIILSDGHGMGVVPKVVGFTIELATERLKEAGYSVKIVQKPSNFATGYVLEQEYEEGTELEKDSEIELVVSTGPEGIDRTKVVTIPDILGMDYDQAQKELAKYKLFAVIDQEVYNPSVPENQVMAQSPLNGENAHQGDTVYVTVNRKTQMVYVPDVIDKTLSMALSELEEQGLVVITKEAENEDYKPGVVFAQNVKPGTKVAVGSEITLTVSTGLKVLVPDVTGERLSTARNTLSDAGLSVTVTYEASSSVSKDRVITHDYINQKVEKGTQITLVVSGGPTLDSSGDSSGAVSLTSLVVSKVPAKTEYYAGETFDPSGLEIIAKYSDGSQKNVTNQCNILGANLTQAGSTTVKVTFEDNGIEKTASVEVTVKKPSIKTDSSITVVAGQSRSVSAVIEPSDASVQWQSADSSIATVSGGTVRGVKAGRTSITATITFGGEEYTSTTTVYVSEKEIPVERIDLDRTSINLRIGGKQTLTATPYPANATNPGFKWTSSNDSVAGVTQSGEVQGNGAGTATITVTSANGKSTKCTVTVKAAAVTKIEISKFPKILNYYRTEKIDLTGLELRVTYDNGSSDLLSDISKMTCNHDSFATKGTKNVTISYGGASVRFTVEVMDAKMTVSCNVKTLNINDTVQISVDAMPETIKVTYSSLTPSIASVNSSGLVTALKAGTARIKVNGTHGDIKFEETVEIKVTEDAITGFTIKTPSKTSYFIGDVLDTSGLMLNITRSSGAKETIEPNSMVKVYFKNSHSSTLTQSDVSGGKATVVVEYSGVSTTRSYTVTVKTPSIRIDKSTLSVEAGGTAKELTVTTVECGDNYEISWESSNSSVAVARKTSNDRKAEISGVTEGKTQIKAVLTYKGNKYYSEPCEVTVKGATISRIEFANISGTYYVGDRVEEDLSIRVTYSNNVTETIRSGFTCSPDEFTSKGSKTVTVSYGGKSASTSVTVKEPTLTLNFTVRQISTALNDSHTATVTCVPNNGKWEITYKSSDPDIVEVGKTSGVVVGKSAGTATISVVGKYNGGSREISGGSRSVTVVSAQATSFAISQSASKTTYYIGEEVDISGLKLTVNYGNDAKDENDSSGNIDAYFTGRGSSNSKKLTPNLVSGGRATVTIYYKGLDNQSVPYNVTVKEPSIEMNGNSTVELRTNSTVSVSYDFDVAAADKSSKNYSVTFESSSDAVSIDYSNDSTVRLKGKEPGEAQVRAVLEYKGYTYYSDYITVTVS